METGPQNFDHLWSAEQQQIITESRAKLAAAQERDLIGTATVVGEFAQKLRTKYSKETNDVEMYHLLAGSGLQTPCSKFDFEGEDSIATFIESL